MSLEKLVSLESKKALTFSCSPSASFPCFRKYSLAFSFLSSSKSHQTDVNKVGCWEPADPGQVGGMCRPHTQGERQATRSGDWCQTKGLKQEPSFSLSEKGDRNMGRGKARMSRVIWDWNCRSCWELMFFFDIYKTLHPTIVQYPFFSRSRRTFTKIDNILGHQQVSVHLKDSSHAKHTLTTMELNQKLITQRSLKMPKYLETQEHSSK